MGTPQGDPKYRILIVDDEWMIADSSAGILIDAGYDIAGPLGSTPPALGLIDKEHVDAALLDVRLGDGDSFAIADALAKRGIPFVFMTGFARVDIPSAYASSVILSKPATAAQLVDAVAALLVTEKQVR